MNLFLIGWRPDGGLDGADAEGHVRRLLAQLPPGRPAHVRDWIAPSGRLVLACATHGAEHLGSVRYAYLEEHRWSLFSGRPIRCTGEDRADGRSPLDPCFYLAPEAEWLHQLDGRWVAARYDDRRGALEMFADALGAYPLYRGRAGKTHWLSNSAELVRDAVGSGEIEPAATAGLIATGWSLSWNPLWAGVHRITQGAVLALDADGSERETHQLPLAALATMIGAALTPTARPGA